MISSEKQYEFITSQINGQVERIYGAFRLFIQLFSAIVGGSVWLSIQEKIPKASIGVYATISNALVIIVGILTTVMILGNLHSWRGYRHAQARLDHDNPNPLCRIPPPKLYPAAVIETAMILCIGVACWMYCKFNPFGLISN